MNFKRTKQTDKNLNDLAGFLGKNIDKLESLKSDIKPKEYYCDACECELYDYELEWQNDTPICPNCGTKINL